MYINRKHKVSIKSSAKSINCSFKTFHNAMAAYIYINPSSTLSDGCSLSCCAEQLSPRPSASSIAILLVKQVKEWTTLATNSTNGTKIKHTRMLMIIGRENPQRGTGSNVF